MDSVNNLLLQNLLTTDKMNVAIEQLEGEFRAKNVEQKELGQDEWPLPKSLYKVKTGKSLGGYSAVTITRVIHYTGYHLMKYHDQNFKITSKTAK